MGARLVVRFNDGTDNPPRVYLHWGGEYVDEITRTLDNFTDAISELSDQRLDDAPYLAAKFVVWSMKAIDSLGCGIVTDDGWGDAVAELACDGTDKYRILSALDLPQIHSGGKS